LQVISGWLLIQARKGLAGGEQVSYAELNDRSIRLANLLGSLGLAVGDSFAVLAENHVRYFELYWAAARSGLYMTPLNSRLAAEEVAYQVNDSRAKVFIATIAMAEGAQEVLELIDPAVRKFMIGGTAAGFESYEDAIAGASPAQPEYQPLGDAMLYSSGTTGRPKGIKRPLRDLQIDDPGTGGSLLMLTPGADSSLVYLNPPNWPVTRGYLVEIEGDPDVTVTIGPPAGHFDGAVTTAMPCVNAIPMVCAAAPGLLNQGELPLVHGSLFTH
jgi:acyl-coenzyme A synthetase/AMP-(fatty) acid ligase